jgi:hypothetical protein
MQPSVSLHMALGHVLKLALMAAISRRFIRRVRWPSPGEAMPPREAAR